MRNGQDAPLGLRVQALLSGTNGSGKYSPPSTNRMYDTVAPGSFADGYYVPAGVAEYRVRTTWMGNNNAGIIANDAGLPGFVSAYIMSSNTTREGWLRVFSESRITNAAYYADVCSPDTLINHFDQMNYAWNEAWRHN